MKRSNLQCEAHELHHSLAPAIQKTNVSLFSPHSNQKHSPFNLDNLVKYQSSQASSAIARYQMGVKWCIKSKDTFFSRG